MAQFHPLSWDLSLKTISPSFHHLFFAAKSNPY
jgi:hypothetical protein